MKSDEDWYLIDAFVGKQALGNPAVVVLHDEDICSSTMSALAQEYAQPATTFLRRVSANLYETRWWSPYKKEIPICGHGSMAAAHLLFNILSINDKSIVLTAPGGEVVIHKGDKPTIELEARHPQPMQLPDNLVHGVNKPIVASYKDANYVAVLENAEAVRSCKPDFETLAKEEGAGLILMAEGDDTDTICRMFIAGYGGTEDPATGSAHATVVPYFSERMSKSSLSCRQASPRGGYMEAQYNEEKKTVLLKGGCSLRISGRYYA